MPSSHRRRSIEAVASGCVAAVVLAACAPVGAPRTEGSSASSTRAEPGLPTDTMRSIADHLRSSMPCDAFDRLSDDLAFWDAMQGFDCSSPGGPSFVRVYAHAASVPQTLADWEDTFGAERTVARGAHWYVIGTPSVVRAVEAPSREPELTEPLPQPTPLTPEQDYLTTCTRYVASEGERYLEHPHEPSSSAEQYEVLFPGATSALHAEIDGLHPEAILAVNDHDRWIAALSPIGPRMKDRCGKAYEKVRDTVRSTGEDDT